MHQQCHGSGNLRNLQGAHIRIAKEGTPKPLVLVAAINGKASKYNDWDGVGHVPAELTG
jgi:hypothetical protein